MNRPALSVLAMVGALAIIWLAMFGTMMTYDAVADDNITDGMWDMMGDMWDMGDMHGMRGGGGPKTTGSASGEGAVLIADFRFEPTVLTVTPGTVVTWTNEDSAPHTATGDNFDSGRLNQEGSASVTFETPGEYGYKCEYHKSMVGQVIVSARVYP